jgi:predicted nucleic acid-binding protein
MLERVAARNHALISSRVLQEFYVAVTRKLAHPLPYEQAERAVRNLAQLPVVYIDLALIMAAMKTGKRFDLSFWDSLIVEAARGGGASCLYTEDLQNGQVVSGVEIRNPFSGADV